MGQKTVQCAQHGETLPTFVCTHLVESLEGGTGSVGFFYSAEMDDDEARPNAWCAACEQVLQREGGWNDASESFAHIRLLCAGCWDRARELNEDS